ncbi:MAG: calcium-binding protein, partial [Arcobacter sp.]|uniref:calcium-binding protein n=1 Tax=Arcobacter sp. TaxID=1872629 RepID=UPI002A747AD1
MTYNEKTDAKTITSYYLFGQTIAPKGDELLDDKWVGRSSPEAIVFSNSEFNEYMTSGPGRFANASQISLVDNFFDWTIPADLLGESQTFTLTEAINAFGGSYKQGLLQSDYKDEGGYEWAERVYLFETQTYALNQNVIFHIDENGNKYIENFAIMLQDEDFDFNGGFWSNIGNAIIEPDVDPSGIGKTIDIVYPHSVDSEYHVQYGSMYDISDYYADITRYNEQNHGTLAEVYSPIMELIDKLWDSGITKFIDSQGRAIIYGTNGADSLTGAPHSAFFYGSKMQEYYWNNLKNGIAIVAGDGTDTLIGTAYNDKLIGGAGSDTMKGGNGNDTYIADNGDTISDDDGLGAVYLGVEHLDGGEKETIKHIEVTTTNFTKTFIYCECNTVTKWSDVETDEWLEEEEFYVDKATGTKYILNGSSLSVISSSGSITINNFSDGDLGISLSETESIDKKEITKEVFLEEDFCSPLVLDLNGNGINSTRLNESSVYFDMDGDGFKERTAWVENGDGLLVLDKNANGTIDNGSELFGNFTALADGNNADDGFSALLQHDENKDGKIDKNDAIYNKLNVWVDANQDGITDAGELKSLEQAGVASVNLNPYQSLMSYLDQNQDGVLNTQDEAFNYVLLRQDDNGGVTLFIPQVDNQRAKELFENYKGTDIITTSNGDLLVNGISFANVANIATQGNDTLDGTQANDKIIALDGNDVLEGKAGNDIIEAGAGDDTISGGRGNDLLRGGEGNDVYLFERGDGIDTIEEIGGVDRIVFGDGIAHDGIITVIDGNDLIIAVKNGNTAFNDLSDKVIVADWFTQASRIETFEFSDDVILSASDIISSVSLYEDTVIQGRVIAPDAASNVSSYVLVSDVVNGSLEFNEDGTYSFDSTGAFDSLGTNETSTVSFTYAALDANGNQSSVKEVSLNVMGVNEYPIGTGDSEVFIYDNSQSTVTVEGFDANDKIFIQDTDIDNLKIIRGTGLQSDTVVTTNADEYYFRLNIGRPSGSISSTYVTLYAVKRDGSESHNLGTYNYYSGAFTTRDVFGSNQPYAQPYDRMEKWSETDFNNLSDLSIYVFSGNEMIGDQFEASIAMNYSGGNTNRYDNFQQLLTFNINQSIFDTIHNSPYYTPPLMVLEDIVLTQSLEDVLADGATSSSSEPVTIINQKITEADITVENIIGQNDSYQTLQDAGINELELNSAFVDDKENGNPVTYEGTYTDTDGAEHKVSDVWFDRDSKDTKYVYEGVIDDDILALPESSGSGRMKDLSMLMAEDGSAVATLNSLLTNAKTSNWGTLNANVDALLAKWTQTESIGTSQTRGIHSVLNHSYAAPSSVATYRVYAYAREVAILEAYTGSSFAMNVNGEKTTDVMGSEMSEEIRKKYERLHYDQLTKIIAQDLFTKDVYDSQTDSLDMGTVLNGLATILENSTDVQERNTAINLLSGLIYKDGLSPALVLGKSVLEMPDVVAQLAQADIHFVLSDTGISGNVGRYEYGTSFDDMMDYGGGGTHDKNTNHGKTIYAGDGADSVVGTNSHDVIYGGAGDDVLRGYAGDDLIFGGAGNDTLYAAGTNASDSPYGHAILEGGQGDDILYGTGRQTTFIYRYGDGHDTIIDGGNVGSVPDVLEFRDIQSGDIKVVVGENANDMLILVRDMETGSFETPSGSVLIKNGFDFVEANNGSYSGSKAMEQFVFADGVLSYQELSERFSFGNNTYSFAKGDGVVTIEEVGGHDKLYFGEGITTSNIRVKVLQNGDLVVGVDESDVAFENLSDRVILSNGTATAGKIEEFIFQDGTVWNHVAMMALQSGTSEADFLDFSQSNSNLIINALGGDDTVTTGGGSDLISGGLGDDSLYGGGGNDTYVYNALEGHDTIFDSSGVDTLKFTAGITSDMIEVVKDGTDLIVGLSEGGTVRITNWYVKENRIESFLFEEDGSTLNISQIHDLVPNKEGVIIGTDDADTLVADPAYGAIVYAQGGDDEINGSDNSDLIYGEDGNDILIGHGSNDLLYGGAGNDTYVYNLNDGIDTIFDTEGVDTLEFGDAITAADLIVRRDGDSIIIGIEEIGKTFAELNNKVVISDWYKSTNRIENIVFADGSTLGAIDLVALMGTTQNDEIIGLDGDNIFEGLSGDDILRGKNFNDTYIIGLNEGNDTIIDSYGQDKLIFKEGVLASDVKVQWKQGTDDIAISIEGSEDIITIQNWYKNGRIETFEFNDGTQWTYAQIIDAMATQYDDVYLGVDADNVIHSLGGDDIISTFSGNDIVDGGEGHDVLESSSGDDTLIGSGGDDFMAGGIGNDTYIYNLNDGQDYITDLNGLDTLHFTQGITKEMLRFKVDEFNNNLLIAVASDATSEVDFDTHNQTILIEDWFNANHRIETISFANGETLDVDAFMQLVQTSQDDVAKALVEGITLNTHEGDDILLGNDGADTLNAGAGDDVLHGGKGDDILDAGTGIDFSNGQAGNDTYIFGRGYGKDSVQDHAQASYQTYGYITDPLTNQSYWGAKTANYTINGGVDAIEFASDITTSDIVVRISGQNLLVGLLEEGKSFEELSDVLEIMNFSDTNQKIENFRFADGTVLSVDEMLNFIFTDEDDTVTFEGNANHNVYAKAGNDIVNFGNGSDSVRGEAGDDILRSEEH